MSYRVLGIHYYYLIGRPLFCDIANIIGDMRMAILWLELDLNAFSFLVIQDYEVICCEAGSELVS